MKTYADLTREEQERFHYLMSEGRSAEANAMLGAPVRTPEAQARVDEMVAKSEKEYKVMTLVTTVGIAAIFLYGLYSTVKGYFA